MSDWGWPHFLLQGLVILGFSLFATRKLRLGLGAMAYLALAPFLLWYQGSLWILVFGLAQGWWLCFGRNRRLSWLVLAGIAGFSLWQFQQGIIIDYPIQLINQLRGEHIPAAGIVARLLHNKGELTYFWLKTVESQLSPARLYIAGSFRLLSPYYLLGLLYPWDAWFHLQAIKRWLGKPDFNPYKLAFFVAALFWLGLSPKSTLAQLSLVALVSWLQLLAVSAVRSWRWIWLWVGMFTLWQVYLAFNFIEPL